MRGRYVRFAAASAALASAAGSGASEASILCGFNAVDCARINAAKVVYDTCLLDHVRSGTSIDLGAKAINRALKGCSSEYAVYVAAQDQSNKHFCGHVARGHYDPCGTKFSQSSEAMIADAREQVSSNFPFWISRNAGGQPAVSTARSK